MPLRACEERVSAAGCGTEHTTVLTQPSTGQLCQRAEAEDPALGPKTQDTWSEFIIILFKISHNMERGNIPYSPPVTGCFTVNYRHKGSWLN